MIDINSDAIFQNNSRVRRFWRQEEWRNFGRDESRTSWRETKKMQIKLATTCNKNEQQQNAKNNTDVWTKWTKTTWKTFEDTIRWGRNNSTKA
jgi:hypothetical protein